MESSRTVVVSGVPTVLSDSRMVDKLTIHFQSGRRSGGGDVEEVTFPTNMDGVAFVTFDKAEDAEKVVRKKKHVLKDGEFSEDYTLTVFPFSTDVFLYVSKATVDLSVFRSDQASLIELLQSTHRSIRFRSSPEQGKAYVEGPLSAIKALKEDLYCRAKLPKPSTQTVKPKDTSSNPVVPSHDEPVGYVGFSGTKAERKPGGSSGKSELLQSSSEAGELRSIASKPESQQGLSQSLAPGSFRHVIGGESSEATGNFSDWKSVKAKPAKQQEYNRSEWISAAKTGGENPTVHRSSTTNRREVSTLSTSTHDGGKHLCTEDSEDIWVDLYIFKYAEKFHKNDFDRCLKGVNVVIKHEGADIMRLSLTDKKPSELGSSYFKVTLEDFKDLMDFLGMILRVQTIVYDKSVLLNKEKLVSICDKGNSLYSDVLYLLEDSCIKVVGPPASSHMFCRLVEMEMSKVKGQHVDPKATMSQR
ncbi:uncharacterized protein [Nothobranchius furzeri]|uniref:RNA binding motif protein 43 n=1 Tax=Nothobranchius furzeri TaxID=105023 RepID=A0A8C6KIA6_NOTFU|nr:RNA binding motif protein 43 [Nothobranchius furzeri]